MLKGSDSKQYVILWASRHVHFFPYSKYNSHWTFCLLLTPKLDETHYTETRIKITGNKLLKVFEYFIELVIIWGVEGL